MSRDDRRDAIAAATVPLLVEHGAAVTTRQIAEAAGVAEGTLFRAFADKDELLRAAVVRSLDPQPLVDAILALPGDDLPALVRELAGLLAEAQRAGMRVFAAAHQVLGGRFGPGGGPPGGESRTAGAGAHPPHPGLDARQRSAAALGAAIEERLQPHRDELRVPVSVAAVVVSSFVLAPAVAHLAGGSRLDADQVADLLLHGIAEPTGTDPSP